MKRFVDSSGLLRFARNDGRTVVAGIVHSVIAGSETTKQSSDAAKWRPCPKEHVMRVGGAGFWLWIALLCSQ
jgi:hypothetical protein